MLKNILELTGVSALNNEKQKEVSGGNTSFVSCTYHCEGRNYVLDSGQGPDCYLNYPSLITNHPSCGGTGGSEGTGGGGIRPTGGGIEVWA